MNGGNFRLSSILPGAIKSAIGINSSETALTGSATFTGAAENPVADGVAVSCKTDAAGTLYFDFSGDDGTNWETFPTAGFTVAAGIHEYHTAKLNGRSFRVRLVNDSGAQSYLRLYTYYGTHTQPNAPLNQGIGSDNDAVVSRAGNEYITDVTRGFHADKFTFTRWGFNGAVPNGSFADIWSYGPTDATYNWPATTEAFRIRAGGNVADDAAGTGARSVVFEFLDGNGDRVTETIATAGASASASTATIGRRFIRAYVATAGAILSNNTAAILIENATTGNIVAVIDAGAGSTQMSMYTIPLGYTAYLQNLYIDVTAGTNKDCDVRLWQRTNAYTTSAPFGAKRLVRQFKGVQGEVIIEMHRGNTSFAALTDLWFDAQGNGAASAVTIEYDLLLIKD